MNFADQTLSEFDDWDLSDRYEIRRQIGSGSYGDVVEGTVCQCIVTISPRLCADLALLL